MYCTLIGSDFSIAKMYAVFAVTYIQMALLFAKSNCALSPDWFITRFSDFNVSSVINAGDCVPTEVFTFSTADDACKSSAVEMFVLLSVLASQTLAERITEQTKN